MNSIQILISDTEVFVTYSDLQSLKNIFNDSDLNKDDIKIVEAFKRSISDTPEYVDQTHVAQSALRYYIKLLELADKNKCFKEVGLLLIQYKENFDLYHIIQSAIGEMAIVGSLKEPSLLLHFLSILDENDWAYKRVLGRYLICTASFEDRSDALLCVFIKMRFEWAVIELIPMISEVRRKELFQLMSKNDVLTRGKRYEVKKALQDFGVKE